MDKISAKNLIKETFSYPFNEEKFSKFSVNLLERIKRHSSPLWQNNTALPLSIKEQVSQYKIFGQLEYKNREKIIVAMIKLKSSEIVEKSRYIQRNFAKWLIDKNESDACLISFFADNYDDWRFSLVRIDYKREETKTGKIKIKSELTPIRRHSYLVGKNEPSHTAQTQLSPLLFDENKNPSLDKITEAFSIEKVTESFYQDYVSIFDSFENFIKKNYNIQKNELRMFTQILFNRLMFVRFLEKKNWLKFGRSKNYLNTLYQEGDYRGKTFFTGRLKPLFFNGLGQEGLQEHDAYGKVCFLNGGLFEETKLDQKINNLPNWLFKDILDIDGLFYRYNFTVEESTPLEIQVSVDPEMLGKVFEELITSREKTGAYYTPREIVSFMCKEGLKKYFNNSELLNNKNLSSKKIEKYKTLLTKIKILDPACGSGAYLVGMLNELMGIYELIYKKNFQDTEINLFKYKLKLKIIQNNIYGVDIDNVAVQIARLRLWLTLIVDFEGNKPEPLPNLDLKIETGDSLTSKNLKNVEPDMFFEDVIKKFESLKLKFQTAKRKDTKINLLDEINTLKNTIKENFGIKTNSGDSFEWRVEFAEVFSNLNKDSGFDIVLANPPYGIRIGDDLRKVYVDNEKLSKDIFVYFILRGFDLLRHNGVLCYIVSDVWRTLKSFFPLRKLLLNWNVNHYIDLPQWIFKATVNTNILTVMKNQNAKQIVAADLKNLEIATWSDLKKYLAEVSNFRKEISNERVGIYEINKSDIKERNNYRFIIGKNNLYKKLLDEKYEKFTSIASAKQGLCTGDNKWYLRKNKFARGNYKIIDHSLLLNDDEINNLSQQEKLNGVSNSQHGNRCFIPYDKGGESDIGEHWLPNFYVPTNYYIDWSKESVTRLKTITMEEIKKFYKKNNEIKSSDRGRIASRFQNFNHYFKVALTYSPTGFYAPTFRLSSNTIFSDKGCNIFLFNKNYSLLILLGILCSKTIKFVCKSYISHGVDFSVDCLNQLHIPKFSKAQKAMIEKEVKKIIQNQKKNNRYDYKQELLKINETVNKAFNLNKYEINEIELWYKRRYSKLNN